MGHAGFARNLESALAALVERGHEVTVVLEKEQPRLPHRRAMLERIAAGSPSFSILPCPERKRLQRLGVALRTTLDYALYQGEPYAVAGKARERAGQRLPWLPRTLVKRSGSREWVTQMARMERRLPVPRHVRRFISGIRPDVVAVTPLVELGSPQVDFVRAAQRLEIPVALAVASWDNLTTKGGVHAAPELVLVWNEAQRDEAVRLHSVPASTIAVTGAVAYDHWFGDAPPVTREELCRRAGLDSRRPFILYVGSSGFLAPDEGAFMCAWVDALRREQRLGDMQILIRPHPLNAPSPAQLESLHARPGVRVYPESGSDPVDPDSRAEYGATLRNAVAIVGINTSAMLEGAIAGRPVCSVGERYVSSQLGTLHFQHLLAGSGGPVQMDDSFTEHARRLADLASGESDEARRARERFVARFVRAAAPKSGSAGAMLVDELERLAGAQR